MMPPHIQQYHLTDQQHIPHIPIQQEFNPNSHYAPAHPYPLYATANGTTWFKNATNNNINNNINSVATACVSSVNTHQNSINNGNTNNGGNGRINSNNCNIQWLNPNGTPGLPVFTSTDHCVGEFSILFLWPKSASTRP